MVRLLALAALALAVPAERRIDVGSFDRIRVTGALDVRVVAGRSPRATLSGDPQVLNTVDARVDGATLVLRRRGGTAPVAVSVTAPALTAAALVGDGHLHISGMKGARASVSLTGLGAGAIKVDGVSTEAVDATVVGGGRIVLAGRAGQAKLVGNGGGAIDASALVVDDLSVRVDGGGEMLAQARYTAAVYSSGSGRVVVSGKPKCTVRAPAGAKVSCAGR